MRSHFILHKLLVRVYQIFMMNDALSILICQQLVGDVFWYLVLTRVTTNECYKCDNAALLYTMCLPSRLGSLLVIITIFFILASNIIERKKV